MCPDYDGLVSSFKWICDALVKLRILKDDNMKVIGAPDYFWESAPPKKGFISIEITELQ